MNWLLVSMGGAIGATLRYGTGMLIAKPQMLFPWPTWWINIIGCPCVPGFSLPLARNTVSCKPKRGYF